MRTFFRPPLRARSTLRRRWLAPGFDADITVALEAAAVTFTGQTANANYGLGVTVGALTFTGQSINAIYSYAAGVGALTFTGQTANVIYGLGVTAGALTFTGQSVSLLDLSPSNVSRAPLYLPARSGRLASLWRGIRGTS